jgi:membrane associated rhomboid family serine protease
MNLAETPIALITFVIMIGASLWGLLKDQSLIQRWVFRPYDFVHRKRYATIITSGFVHGDFPHLIFNAITFYFFAFKIEQVFGSLQFFFIYYGSMIIADIPSLIKFKNYEGYGSLGASGAISGVLFAFILIAPKAKLGLLIIPFVPIPAIVFGLMYLAWEQYSSKRQDGINHEAHIWGAIAGLAITIILIPGILPHFWSEIMNW